ncbi:MAG: hypothetical protein MUC89_23020, partial [Acetobacteraceae bacterium]|nr:hypothetical protein [Acetobacteraceae bacterium]
MTQHSLGRRSLLGTLGVAVPLAASLPAAAQPAAPGTLRVALLADIANFDPHQFSFVNASLIKNLYDSLIEYTPEGRAVPSLAEAWSIAADSRSVTVTLRRDVKF